MIVMRIYLSKTHRRYYNKDNDLKVFTLPPSKKKTIMKNYKAAYIRYSFQQSETLISVVSGLNSQEIGSVDFYEGNEDIIEVKEEDKPVGDLSDTSEKKDLEEIKKIQIIEKEYTKDDIKIAEKNTHIDQLNETTQIQQSTEIIDRLIDLHQEKTGEPVLTPEPEPTEKEKAKNPEIKGEEGKETFEIEIPIEKPILDINSTEKENSNTKNNTESKTNDDGDKEKLNSFVTPDSLIETSKSPFDDEMDSNNDIFKIFEISDSENFDFDDYSDTFPNLNGDFNYEQEEDGSSFFEYNENAYGLEEDDDNDHDHGDDDDDNNGFDVNYSHNFETTTMDLNTDNLSVNEHRETNDIKNAGRKSGNFIKF
ncbi:hypothetical protein HZS_1123 [Henneguya salminicola]|nr:hypothetical protein HZS_1123 [Henneguya salminicola]